MRKALRPSRLRVACLRGGLAFVAMFLISSRREMEGALQRFDRAMAGAFAATTGPSLRVATFNTQLYSPAMKPDWRAKLALFSDDTERRAARIADRILAGGDAPDILALNEVWDEDAKDVLVTKLRGTYPHYLEKIDVLSSPWRLLPERLEDSGLMLFSRYPFVDLPRRDLPVPYVEGTTDKVAFVAFDDATDVDRHAAKGAALVRVRVPHTGTTYGIVLTHLQSGEGAAPAVRAKQMADIEALIRRYLGADADDELLVLGDLNINGVDAARSPPAEWMRYFAQRTSFFVQSLYDAWVYTTSPADPGRTGHDGERLDYILHRRPPHRDERTMSVVQHIALTLRGLSDHLGLVADLNLPGSYSTPRLARVLGEAASPHADRWHYGRLEHPGSMQWYRIDHAGTYCMRVTSNSPGAPVLADVYRKDDLSTPLVPLERPADSRVERGYAEVRARYALPEPPYFVRVYHPDRRFFGTYRLHLHLQRGTGRDDAVMLEANEAPVAPEPLQVEPGRRWFTLDVGHASSGKPHRITAYADNPERRELALELRNGDGDVLARGPWSAGARIALDADVVGPERLFLVVERRGAGGAAYRVGWSSRLTYLHGHAVPGAWNFEFLCDDETGPDFFGDDEIELHIEADGVLHTVNLPDVNVGGYYYLDDQLAPIAFSKRARIWVDEVDGKWKQHGPAIDIPPLVPDGDGPCRKLRQSVALRVDGGRYRFRFNLSSSLPR